MGINACAVKKQATENKKHSTIIVYSHLLKNVQWQYNVRQPPSYRYKEK